MEDNEKKLEDLTKDEIEENIEISKEDKILKITTEKGEVKEYEIVSFLTTEDGDYLVYTDNTVLDNGNILLYINSMYEEDGKIILDEVDEDETDEIVKEIQERMSD